MDKKKDKGMRYIILAMALLALSINLFSIWLQRNGSHFLTPEQLSGIAYTFGIIQVCGLLVMIAAFAYYILSTYKGYYDFKKVKNYLIIATGLGCAVVLIQCFVPLYSPYRAFFTFVKTAGWIGILISLLQVFSNSRIRK